MKIGPKGTNMRIMSTKIQTGILLFKVSKLIIIKALQFIHKNAVTISNSIPQKVIFIFSCNQTSKFKTVPIYTNTIKRI